MSRVPPAISTRQGALATIFIETFTIAGVRRWRGAGSPRLRGASVYPCAEYIGPASRADYTHVRTSVLVVALAASCTPVVRAESPAEFEQRVRSAMEQSVQRQRESVQKQSAAAVPQAKLPAEGFFSVPWPAPAAAAVFEAPCDAMPQDKLQPLVDDAAKREGVQADLIRAVIDQESAAKPCAVSAKGAQGLMQLMPAVSSDMGVKDPFDPKQNVDAGTRLLKQLLAKYGGDVALALGAYNAGSGSVDRAGGIPPIPETVKYVSDILGKVSA